MAYSPNTPSLAKCARNVASRITHNSNLLPFEPLAPKERTQTWGTPARNGAPRGLTVFVLLGGAGG